MKKYIVLSAVILSFISFGVQQTYAGENSNVKQENSVLDIQKKDPKLIVLPKDVNVVSEAQFKQKLAQDNAIYLKNKKKLWKQDYNLYTILDKLLRANNLEYQNWRIGLQRDPDSINACSGSLNAITIDNGLYDSFYNDRDSLAFVVAHELSHLIHGDGQKHYEKAYKIAEYRKKMTDMNDGVEPSDGIYLYKVKTAELKLAAMSREFEQEADIEGIKLMTRAGFDPNGANRMVKALSQMPHVYRKTNDHPDVNYRISYVNDEVANLDISRLQNEGKNNLCNSQALNVIESGDRIYIILSNPIKFTKQKYVPETKENLVLQKAYKSYLNDDMQSAKADFLKAHELNDKNIVPLLYLSYIDEYGFKISNNKNMLKESNRWIKKAVKINPYDKNVQKQMRDLENL